MNKDTLIQLFKASYKRQAFIDNVFLPTFQDKVANLKIYDAQGLQLIELTASEQNYAVSAVKYGEFQTLDEIPRTVELYEIIVNDNKQIERSRVGLGALVKKHIIGNNAVLVNFAYQNPEKRSWRFSFIARDGVFQDGEMQITDTHPKRYTYVFGEPEETYKTALDRFFILGNELEITINKIKDAFGVEAMSKAFFDEYRDVHYAGFVDYLMRSNFKKTAFNGIDKDVRDFIKKLLGRIVFLYFLQKKGWLGAKDTSYKNGDKNFMTNFFKKAGSNDSFYANWLSKLFFDALNNERHNDDFIMPDGESVKIPYLNGGLFEKETEKYDFLTFPTDLFTNLFEFFDQYNFTIFEDSAEEHTVAVDPEMLGHIFENLLEDNKDKGAFYTPKEIVHYMTQESLIEYLQTQITELDRTELENFVKNKEDHLSKEHKAAIDQKLNTVKICDPAIGSGAFPMGLLQEIFGLKERIAYDLGLPWSGELAAKTKENIIQSSIYGVDIERGAVDIARLRFWLSLIVDEELPKALPNLDYKIVVGNSLVSKFNDTVIEIDWSEDTAKEGLFGQGIAEEKKKLLVEISNKQAKYFTADGSLKEKLKLEIRNLKLDILTKQLELMIENKGFKSNSIQGLSKKQIEAWQQTQDWKKALNDIKVLKNNLDKDFNHFDWKLDFPEVLNPLVNEVTGFDIVIGNPPYINIYLIAENDKISYSRKYKTAYKKYDLYVLFYELSFEIIKFEGNINLITSNKYFSQPYGLKLRELFLSKEIIEIINFRFNIFNATVDTAITSLRNSPSKAFLKFKDIFNAKHFKNLSEKEHDILELSIFESSAEKNFRLEISPIDVKLISEIKSKSIPLSDICYINYGCRLVSKDGSKKKGDYIFDSKEKAEYKKFIEGKNIKKYRIEGNKYVNYQPQEHYLSLFTELFEIQKLVSKDVVGKDGIQVAFDSEGLYNDHTTINAVKWSQLKDVKYQNVAKEVKIKNLKLSEEFSYEYLLAIINSQVNNYIFNKLYNIDLHFYPNTLQMMPIFKIESLSIKTISCFNISLFKTSFTLNPNFPNSHISEALEEVINALVFELYFPDEFAEKGIVIEKYAQELFKPIEGLSEEEQIKAIQEAYQTLREKDNPLRNQIKLMKIELKELLLPILSV